MTEHTAEIAALAHSQFESLEAAGFPYTHLGGALFLGEYYAEPQRGMLMLGINPGGRTNKDFGAGLSATNCLLEGEPLVKFPYWRNAKYLFGREPLRQAMETATYSFCSPFRTPDFNLSKADRALLVSHSRAILRQMLGDCLPRLIIVAGVSGEGLLREIAGESIRFDARLPGGGDQKGTYQWRAFRAAIAGAPGIVAQIPHLSRANAKHRLDECREWLVGLVGQV